MLYHVKPGGDCGSRRWYLLEHLLSEHACCTQPFCTPNTVHSSLGVGIGPLEVVIDSRGIVYDRLESFVLAGNRVCSLVIVVGSLVIVLVSPSSPPPPADALASRSLSLALALSQPPHSCFGCRVFST